MAMVMKGEVTLPANRATVWAKLNDPDVLKSCITAFKRSSEPATRPSRPP